MATLKWFLVFGLIGYAAFVALLYFTQRSLQYFPDRLRTAPAAVGLPQAQEVVLDTADGERVIVWHVPPRGEMPVILYFHGNGGSLRWRVDRFRALTGDGSGLVALSYRGYGGSSGRPSEIGLMEDAQAAYAFARAHYPTERIVVWGESLGSGLAVALAAQKPVGRLVLQSPFTSAADVAAAMYWFVPVRWLMKDQFRSDLAIGKVTVPVLVLHGERDRIVPIALGERLYALINAPKRFVRFPGAGHNDLGAYGAIEAAKQFLGE
jgi:pimeloyl-ACP methyl ester carboxylesterase